MFTFKQKTISLNKILLLSLFIFILVFIQRRGTHPKKLKAGSICIVEEGNGKFGIVKILVIDDEIAHLKIYRNKFDQPPDIVDIETLRIGSIYDKDGFGIGHTPIDRKDFDNWKLIAIAFEEVTKEDLVGYEIWKEQ